MDEIEESAKAQLKVIELVYGLRITNLKEIVKLIGDVITDERQVLLVCSSLNTWILMNKKEGDVTVPAEVIHKIFETVEWQISHS